MSSNWYGLHELLGSEALAEELREAELADAAEWKKDLPPEELAAALTAHLARTFSDLGASLRERDAAAWKEAVEALTEALAEAGEPLASLPRRLPEIPFRQLVEVRRPEAGAVRTAETVRPDLPLGVSALLTGSSRTPSLVSQVKRELASADHVDWLVSFIKWSGIRPLRDALRRFTEVPNLDGSPRLRVATTSYLGATDLKAVRFLLGLPNTKVRVSYDTRRTRLHAKAYLFHRDTGFGSAYVGSANVSRVALDEGLEWTAKISQHELPYLWRQIEAGFDSHWEDEEEFEALTSDRLEEFGIALAEEKRSGPSGAGGTPGDSSTAVLPFFDLRPYPFQKEILEAIAAERRAGLDRHLVIAATGTGKTMMAAFDYRQFALGSGPGANGHRPSLLFLAHREEILKQSLASFRQVLRDHEFGDLLVGGAKPRQTRHLFASVQSWRSRGLDTLPPDWFDYVVLDEAHHAAADSYQAILDHLHPRVLLGLTATPERADGRDVRGDFGGRFTHELRLPDAIEQTLLAPFHYFGVADEPSVDLSNLRWERGGYRTSDLEGVLGGSEVRARWVRDQVIELLAEPERTRGLGFCVSQVHARFMAERFTGWGLPSVALTAESPKPERARVQRDLRERRIRFIFTVDLYNEGVDIPEVDTVLLLRPTESLTVYLQQIGRGLRLHEEKPHLTVLDFIAPQHRRFRFADRFRALTQNPVERIDRQVEDGFPWLPSGCLVHLDRQAMETVLANIRETLGMRRPQVERELASLAHDLGRRPKLREMLDRLHFDGLDELLRHGLPCRLLAGGGGEPECEEVQPFERGLARGIRALAASGDRAVLETLRDSLGGRGTWTPATGGTGSVPAGAPAEFGAEDRARLELAHSLVWGKERPEDGSLETVEGFVRRVEGLRRDLLEVTEERLERLRPASGVHFPARTGVLELHARYTREQVLLAVGKAGFEEPMYHREGVVHVAERKVDAFFVTIRKTEARFSPTTMYEDYALSDRLFHWQSQSTTSAKSPTGKRYIHHQKLGYTPMLFVRETPKLENGMTAPFCFLGPLQYVKHEGSRPMSVTWRLENAMPAKVVRWGRGVG